MASPARRTIAHVAVPMIVVMLTCGCGGSTGSSEAPPTATASAVAAGPSEASPAVSESPSDASSPSNRPSQPEPFTLSSPAFHDGGAIPKANTCDGADRSPGLRWSGAPNGTAALVLELLDPDANDFVHWLVLDLPGDAAGSLPADVGTGSGAPEQGRNGFGKIGYGGPCPPSGTHHYVFTLFALDAPLGLAGSPTRAQVDAAIARAHLLGKATLTGTYHRS